MTAEEFFGEPLTCSPATRAALASVRLSVALNDRTVFTEDHEGIARKSNLIFKLRSSAGRCPARSTARLPIRHSAYLTCVPETLDGDRAWLHVIDPIGPPLQ